MALTSIPFIAFPQFHPNNGSTLTIDAAEEHIAWVIMAPKTGTIKKIGWRVNASTTPSGLTLRVCLETVADSVGAPVATSYATKTLFAAGAESGDITDPEVGARFDAINGATGIAVTKGDLISVTIRCTAVTSGSIGIGADQYGTSYNLIGRQYITGPPYTYTYVNATPALWMTPILTLEYDGEFVPVYGTVPLLSTLSTYVSWNSGSNPDRRGLKFRLPYGCRLKGCEILIDRDSDADIILYDSDEYTAMAGFPIAIDKDKRKADGNNSQYFEFPTEPTLSADTWYRLVLLPKSVTNMAIATSVPADDGAILGMTALSEGGNVGYTTFNGSPASDSHVWTDDMTKRVSIAVVLNAIDFPAGGGGGLPILGGSVVR